jgi:hypothetical protein
MPKPRGHTQTEPPRAELATPAELLHLANECRRSGLTLEAEHFERIAARYTSMKPAELKRRQDLLR